MSGWGTWWLVGWVKGQQKLPVGTVMVMAVTLIDLSCPTGLPGASVWLPQVWVPGICAAVQPVPAARAASDELLLGDTAAESALPTAWPLQTCLLGEGL